jgi:hypothetical protein
MSNRQHYNEHRIANSLGRHLGRSPSDPDVIDRLACEAYHQNRGIYFTEDQLAAMPWQSRELIESEAGRIHGPRQGRR